MKLLAISDIHNNLVCVRKLRSLEENSFDAIAVTGDIGGDAARGIFKILETFQCPIVYVFGNWDHALSHEQSFGQSCKLVHLNIVTVGTAAFTGLSGDVTKNDRMQLSSIINRSKVDSATMIVLSHERLWRLQEDARDLPLHMFGHIHSFSERFFRGTTFLRVGALDRQLTVRPAHKSKWSMKDCRNVNAGNYTIVEFHAGQRPKVQCAYLPHHYPDWIQAEGQRWKGIRWLPEEEKWTNPNDPPLPQYSIMSREQLESLRAKN